MIKASTLVTSVTCKFQRHLPSNAPIHENKLSIEVKESIVQIHQHNHLLLNRELLKRTRLSPSTVIRATSRTKQERTVKAKVLIEVVYKKLPDFIIKLWVD